MNLANATARVVLELVDLDSDDLYGCLRLKEIPEVRRRIIRALNAHLSDHAQKPFVWGGQRRARVIDCGLSVERVKDRLRRFDELLAYAQRTGRDVTWS
jgi:hypothetical protein